MAKSDTFYNSGLSVFNIDNSSSYETIGTFYFIYSTFFTYLKYCFDYKNSSGSVYFKIEIYNTSNILKATITEDFLESTSDFTNTGIQSGNISSSLTEGAYKAIVYVKGSGVEMKNLILILE